MKNYVCIDVGGTSIKYGFIREDGFIIDKSSLDIEKAKSKEENKSSTTKLNYIGDKVIRGYSEKEPSYSKTLDVW
ncbi:hypothetical protein ACTPEF_25910, partial [Clostridioides difficile]